MDALEWNYVGEGGKHALFAYSPVNGFDEKFVGRLLRLRKKDLARASRFSASDDSTVDEGIESVKDHDPICYIRQVVHPSMAPYVDIPESILVSWCFLQQLRRNTILDGSVPISRRADWSLLPNEKPYDYAATPIGTFVTDYRRLSLPSNIFGEMLKKDRISIEIKPKAGYVAFSPLVHPLHRSKYQRSRFVLLQQLYQLGQVKKGWVNPSKRIQLSEYDPLDLFSNDEERMRKAVSKLFACPQNNLRIWYNDSPLVSQSLSELNFESLYNEIVQSDFDYLNPCKPTRLFVESFVSNILISILCKESLLQKLLQLQELDILDADGATLVWERLVHLCGGSESQAETVLGTFEISDASTGSQESPLQSSPFKLDCDATNLASLCKEFAQFRCFLEGNLQGSASHRRLDEEHNRAKKKVNSLLLEEWMRSTIEKPEDISNPRVQTQRSEGAHTELGNVSYSTGAQTVSFAYDVKLIDCDRKPASKLRQLHEREKAFRRLNDENF